MDFDKDITNYLNFYDDILLKLALYYGYTKELKDQTSTGWVTLKNTETGDQVTINKKGNPQRYFNRYNDKDKGRAYKFVLNRLNGNLSPVEGTKEECKKVREVVRDYFSLPISEKKSIENALSKFEKTIRIKDENSLENETDLNTSALINTAYLSKTKMIDIEVINNGKFRNTILNDFKGKIPNIAFLKRDPNTFQITGSEIKNQLNGQKWHQSKGKDYHLWYSKFPRKINKIAIAESAVDALSHFQLLSKKNSNTLYTSFGGSISQAKMESIIKTLDVLQENKKINFKTVLIELINDNDVQGYNYDFKILSNLINHYSSEYYFENAMTSDKLIVRINHSKEDDLKIQQKFKEIEKTIHLFNQNTNADSNFYRISKSKNTIDVELPIVTNYNSKNQALNISLNGIFQTLQKMYSPIDLKIRKSIAKDWNDDLINSKKKVYMKACLKL